MIKATAIALLALVTPAAAAGCADGKYLRVTLWDSFGDGWGDAAWRLTDPSSVVTTASLDCENSEMRVFGVHPSQNGVYSMTVSSDAQLPVNWWEIYWKVEEMGSDDVATGVYYEGTYDTVMNWEFTCNLLDRRSLLPLPSDGVWTLDSAEDLADFTCDGCSGEKCDKKGKSKAASKKGPMKGGKGKGGKRALHSSSDSNSSTEVTYGERNTDLSVKMWADGECKGDKKKCVDKHKKKHQSCDGWSDEDVPVTPHWYIADSTQTTLFDDGALCEGCAGTCDLCLGDGSYVFRVTGAAQNQSNDDSKVWEFCHARGYFNDELSFHVKKGKCFPQVLRWSNEVCDEQQSMVTVTGVVALGGIPSEFFAARASTIVLETLAQTVNGWSVADMSVTATSLDVRSLAAGSRALRSYTHDIQFSVSFLAEDYFIDGASFVAVEGLLADMSATLEASFVAGAFTDLLQNEARTMHVDVLQKVTGVELVSMEVSNIAYAESRLVYIYSSDDSVSSGNTAWSSSVSNNMIVAFISISALGFIAFVGIAHHGMKSYDKLSTVTDSEVSMQRVLEAGVRTPFGTSTQQYQTVTAPGLQI